MIIFRQNRRFEFSDLLKINLSSVVAIQLQSCQCFHYHNWTLLIAGSKSHASISSSHQRKCKNRNCGIFFLSTQLSLWFNKTGRSKQDYHQWVWVECRFASVKPQDETGFSRSCKALNSLKENTFGCWKLQHNLFSIKFNSLTHIFLLFCMIKFASVFADFSKH